MKPSLIKEEISTPIGIICKDIFGDGYESFKIAHLVTTNGIGIELFEFSKNDKEKPVFKYINTGMFHFSVQDPDIEGLIDKIVSRGGKQRKPIRDKNKL